MAEIWQEPLDIKHGWTSINRLGRIEAHKLGLWLGVHNRSCTGNVTIAQSHTSGIGTNSVVKCGKCNKGLDFTDYEVW